jgi:hypothetical protein
VIEVTAKAIVPRLRRIKTIVNGLATGFKLRSNTSPYPTVDSVITVMYRLSRRDHLPPPITWKPTTPKKKTAKKLVIAK